MGVIGPQISHNSFFSRNCRSFWRRNFANKERTLEKTDKKRKMDEVSAVTGYIQSTNDIKKAKKSETRFFDGTVQISDHEFVRFGSFSPEKLTHSFLLK